VLTRQKIRLLGVDTPELKGATRVEALAARDMTCGLCPAGAQVILESHRDRKEKYGRWLGRIHLADGRCVNDVLRAAGYTRDV
jgi:micrococcal nuclease